MSYTRTDSLTYLSQKFKEQCSDFSGSGFTDDDTTSGWKPIIDAAFLEYGISRSSLSVSASCIASDADALKFQALLDYFALDYFLFKYSSRVDEWTEHPSPDRRSSQAAKQTATLLDRALAKCQGYGFLKDATAARIAHYSTLSVDALEPEDASDD